MMNEKLSAAVRAVLESTTESIMVLVVLPTSGQIVSNDLPRPAAEIGGTYGAALRMLATSRDSTRQQLHAIGGDALVHEFEAGQAAAIGQIKVDVIRQSAIEVPPQIIVSGVTVSTEGGQTSRR
jgi:hypothetical protein